MDKNLQRCIKQFADEIILVGDFPLYRSFDEQLKLFKVGREYEELKIEEKIPLGKKLLRLADSGSIKSGTVTNATPCTSAHNFGMAIDCRNAEELTKKFNDFLGFEYFEWGGSWGDLNHIEVKGFKLPKYSFRWSLFCSPSGYDCIKMLGGLQND